MIHIYVCTTTSARLFVMLAWTDGRHAPTGKDRQTAADGNNSRIINSSQGRHHYYYAGNVHALSSWAAAAVAIAINNSSNALSFFVPALARSLALIAKLRFPVAAAASIWRTRRELGLSE